VWSGAALDAPSPFSARSFFLEELTATDDTSGSISVSFIYEKSEIVSDITSQPYFL